MKMKTQEKIKVFTYCEIKRILNIFRGKNNSDRILIIFPGSIGSAILMFGLLKQIASVPADSDRIEILCKKNVGSLIAKIFPDISIKGIYPDDIHASGKALISTCDSFSKEKYETVVNIFDSSLSNAMLIHSIFARIKIGLWNTDENVNTVERIIKKHIFNDFVLTDYNEFIVNQYMNSLKRAGIDYLTPSLYNFEIEPQIRSEYVAISPGGSSSYKCWDLKNYISLIDYILSNSQYDVFILGDSRDKKLIKKIPKRLLDNNRVTNLIGKTSFKEWINCIANACLLIGNDSAAIHIAASVNTKYICIKGQWYGKKYLPHEMINDNECYVIESSRKKCYLCKSPFEQDLAIKNKYCKQMVENDEQCECIREVEFELILSVLRKTIICENY